MRTITRSFTAAVVTAAAFGLGAGAATADTVAPSPVLTAAASADYTAIDLTVTPPAGAAGELFCSATARNDTTQQQTTLNLGALTAARPSTDSIQGLPSGATYTVTISCDNSYRVNGVEPDPNTTQEVKVSLVKPVTPPPTIPGGLFNFGSS